MSKVHRAQDVSGANHAFQYEVLRTTLGTICACLGGLVLAGWQFDVGLLRSIVPGLIAMQPPTAVCFVLLGFAVTRKRKGAC